jgi:hypothetical protein
LFVEQTVAWEPGRVQGFAQLVLGHHHHLALGERGQTGADRVGELNAHRGVRGRRLKRQHQNFFLGFLSRRELGRCIARGSDQHQRNE